MQRMPGEQRGHKGAGPQRIRQPEQQHEKQERVGRVKQDVDAMMRAGVQAEQLAVQHVRKPGQRMPVAGVPGREGPFDAGPGQAVLDHLIFGDVIVVVIK